MLQQQKQPDNWNVSMAQSFGFLYNISYALMIGVTPFLRRNFGARAFDPHIVITLVMLLLLACADPVMAIYAAAWAFMVMRHRVEGWKLRVHSKYPGEPWVAMRLPLVKTEQQAHQVEPAICLAAALLADEVSWYLPAFPCAAAGAFIVKYALDEWIERARLRAMRDAQIELDYYADKFRREA